MPTIETLTVLLTANTTGLSKGFAKVGTGMTKYVTLPLVAAGAASVALAADFDKSFARIGALAGSIGEPMAKAKEDVLKLAQATGQDPGGLAESLYFVASAGLKASQVMPTLTVVAKAAAAGMGEASDIAQTLTTVLNAFEGTGLNAAKAMDILTAAMKQGKAEPAEYAAVLGQVAGIAANAGIRFEDLAAAMAQASNTLPLTRATTGLRFLISSLESPTSKAASALKDVGLTSVEVADMLTKPGGLQKTLQELYTKTFAQGTAAGREAWNAITGGARGATVAITLVGKHAEQANKILTATAHSGGEFGKAVAKSTNTAAFRMQKLLASLKVLAIQFGELLLPYVQKFVGWLSKMVHWFERLDPQTKQLIVRLGTIAAIMGPLILLVGKLSVGLGALARLFGATATAAGASGAAGATGVLGVSLLVLARRAALGGVGLGGRRILSLGEAASLAGSKADILRRSLEKLNAATTDQDKEIEKSKTAYNAAAQRAKSLGVHLDNNARAYLRGRIAANDYQGAVKYLDTFIDKTNRLQKTQQQIADETARRWHAQGLTLDEVARKLAAIKDKKVRLDVETAFAEQELTNFMARWQGKGLSLAIRTELAGSFIQHHAKGGIFTKPHIGMIAEAGPEAVVPLNKRTGSLLGAGNLKLNIGLDRRRFVKETDYETAYRGF